MTCVYPGSSRDKHLKNAIVVNGAVGGSTNAVIHFSRSRARRSESTLADWDRLGRDVPTLVDLMPSGRFSWRTFTMLAVFLRSSRARPA